VRGWLQALAEADDDPVGRGRSIVYALYDNHVAGLLEQALFRVEHLRLGLRDGNGPRSACWAWVWCCSPRPGC
jgi:hypothetical protein